MGSRSFLYGTFANWVELFQLAKAFYMGYIQAKYNTIQICENMSGGGVVWSARFQAFKNSIKNTF